MIGLVGLLILAYTGVLTINRNIEKTDSINATSEAELAMRQVQPTAKIISDRFAALKSFLWSIRPDGIQSVFLCDLTSQTFLENVFWD